MQMVEELNEVTMMGYGIMPVLFENIRYQVNTNLL